MKEQGTLHFQEHNVFVLFLFTCMCLYRSSLKLFLVRGTLLFLPFTVSSFDDIIHEVWDLIG